MMPHLTNCAHSPDGWCLNCVKELHEKLEKQFEVFKLLFGHAKDTEWMTHNAAENNFCPYCVKDDDRWRDQKGHYDGCQYVEMMMKAKEIIGN
jgi:hypothetical protein